MQTHLSEMDAAFQEEKFTDLTLDAAPNNHIYFNLNTSFSSQLSPWKRRCQSLSNKHFHVTKINLSTFKLCFIIIMRGRIQKNKTDD